MNNAQLAAKFTRLTDGGLPLEQTRRLMELRWNAARLPAAARLARAAV